MAPLAADTDRSAEYSWPAFEAIERWSSPGSPS